MERWAPSIPSHTAFVRQTATHLRHHGLDPLGLPVGALQFHDLGGGGGRLLDPTLFTRTGILHLNTGHLDVLHEGWVVGLSRLHCRLHDRFPLRSVALEVGDKGITAGALVHVTLVRRPPY